MFLLEIRKSSVINGFGKASEFIYSRILLYISRDTYSNCIGNALFTMLSRVHTEFLVENKSKLTISSTAAGTRWTP